MTLAETLKQCHEIVWTYRRELEHVWPTPNTEDALLFAFTELGEAVDAHLRSKPQYARNNAKDLGVLDELADCAMMLLTALPDLPPPWPHERMRPLPKWSYLAMRVSLAVDLYDTIFEWESDAYLALISIINYPGMDLPARLTARLERIKAKRLEATHG